MSSKPEIFTSAAREFVEKAAKLPGLTEIAIVGSVAGGDPYPNDLDLAILISNFDSLAILARLARQIARYSQDLEVFVFGPSLAFWGRICRRKEYPGGSVDCRVSGCGRWPHLAVAREFRFDEKIFFASPVEVLWSATKQSLFLAHQKELKIVTKRSYSILKDVTIRCWICGRDFVIDGGQQKKYLKRGFRLPKRCPACIEREISERMRREP